MDNLGSTSSSSSNPVGDYTAPSRPFEPAPGGRRKRNNLVIIIIIIIALLLGGWFFFARGSNEASKDSEITPTISQEEEPTVEPTEEEEPSETPEPSKKPSPTAKPTPSEVTVAQDMRIQVLNGTGETGIAGQGAEYLKGKGYTNVETGNADREDYTNVTVNIKTSRNKYLDTLVSDLKGKYNVNSDTGTLEDSSDFDATVIIGK